MDTNRLPDDVVIKQMAAEVEAAYRKQGIALPEGMTGETMVVTMLEQMRQEASNPEWQARLKRIDEISHELATELPGGIDDPQFADLLSARFRAEFPPDDSGPAASA